MYKYEISGETSCAIEKHVRERSHFIDTDLLPEWRAGIGFLYDIGLISLTQFGGLYNIFPETET